MATTLNGTHFPAVAVMLAGLFPACSDVAVAQSRPPILQSVDAQIASPPVAVRIDGSTVLVYELHLTNLMQADVAITRIRVYSTDASGAPIADYHGDELRSIVARLGAPRAESDPATMGPGGRNVAYFWIPLSGPPPGALRHAIDIEVRRPTGTVTVSFETPAQATRSETLIVLDAPLRGGPWVAIHDPQLIGGHRTVFYTIGGWARRPGRFAIDFVRLTAGGTLDRALPRPADWNGRGAEVLAVADGIVAAAMDDIPDNVGNPEAAAQLLENASGNYVALDLGGGRFAFYEHLGHGSVAVRSGDRVRRGQVIGRLGNSGSSSIGPHLHFHVSDSSATLAAEGLPFVFRRFEHLGRFTSIDSLMAGAHWMAVPADRAVLLQLERPGANAVIEFP